MLPLGWKMEPAAMVLPLIDRLNENASAMSPSDGINFALNFDVVFQPVLGTTLGFAETSDTHPSVASLPHPFALS
jgi:hypothetical protein